MSFCRWSSDDWACDVYAYESEEGFIIHVATAEKAEIPFLPFLPYERQKRQYALDTAVAVALVLYHPTHYQEEI